MSNELDKQNVGQDVQTSNANIVKKPANLQDRLAAINAIKNKFISTIIKIYVNSLEREVCFREITVQEQKKLARIMIDNENRKDIIYDAQCAILKSICLEDDIDIYQLTEFDKIKLLLMLYQRNMIKHDISFICPECHSENKYQIDFTNVMQKLDTFKIEDKTYKYENQNWIFNFTLAYPKVSRVSEFYSSRYLNMRKTNDKTVIESMNTSINVDYTNLFIKQIRFIDKSSNEETVIDVSEYKINELFDIISVFPQDVLYSDNGIIQHITTEFITKINNAFEKHKCMVCGAECEATSDQSVEGFF